MLAGTDYGSSAYHQQDSEAYLKAKGVKDEDIMINPDPAGHSDWQSIVADIKVWLRRQETAVVSTINGDANVLL